MLVSLSIIFTGYWLGYYGYTTLKDYGVGIVDLLLPSRISKVDSAIQSGPQATAGQTNSSGQAISSGVGVPGNNTPYAGGSTTPGGAGVLPGTAGSGTGQLPG